MAFTVGQWLTLLTASKETVLTHTSAESFIRWRNVQRARKGLPPLPEKKPAATKPKQMPQATARNNRSRKT